MQRRLGSGEHQSVEDIKTSPQYIVPTETIPPIWKSVKIGEMLCKVEQGFGDIHMKINCILYNISHRNQYREIEDGE